MCQPASTVPTGHPVVAGGRLNVQWHRMFVFEAELREEADPGVRKCRESRIVRSFLRIISERYECMASGFAGNCIAWVTNCQELSRNATESSRGDRRYPCIQQKQKYQF